MPMQKAQLPIQNATKLHACGRGAHTADLRAWWLADEGGAALTADEDESRWPLAEGFLMLHIGAADI